MSRLEPTNEASAVQKEISAIAEQGGGTTTVGQLIQQYCPDGVEYKKIKEVYQRIKGTPITAGKMKEIQCPTGEIRIFAGGKTVIDANEADISNANITRVPAVLVQSRGVIDAIYYDKPFTFKNEMWAYTHKEQISVKFLYYVMKQNIQHFRDAASGMGALPQISLGTTEDFVIPIPPLPVQEEIVRILDTFTELQAELQAELQERLLQYNYYRDNLLSFEGRTDIEWKKLGELAKIGDGLHGTPHYSNNTGCFFINGNNLRNGVIVCDENTKQISEEEYEKIKVELDDKTLLMSINGTVGNMAFYKGEHIALGKSAAYFRVNPHFISKFYLYYYLQSSQAHSYYNLVLTGSTIKNLGLKSLREMAIPVPSLEEQQRIVDILDRFNTLTNDITAGLPAEIDARRKQYEYYRDRLLTFKQKA